MKQSVYNFPALYTLEGYPGSDFPVPGISMSGAYEQYDTYRSQDFAVLKGDDWGIFNFLRPSRAKVWLSASGGVLQAIPKTEAIGQGLTAGGQAAAAIHSTYKGGSGDPPYQGTGYRPGDQTANSAQGQNKKIPWVPIVVGAGGILAALSLA